MHYPDAACRGMDPTIFFPERGEDYETAKAVCRTCPRMIECREYAIEKPEKDGIWGGTSARERRRIRSENPRPRRPSPCGSRYAYYRHLEHGEVPCAECRRAHGAYHSRWRGSQIKAPSLLTEWGRGDRLDTLSRSEVLEARAQ